jgi:hypothetical protein
MKSSSEKNLIRKNPDPKDNAKAMISPIIKIFVLLLNSLSIYIIFPI